MAKSLAEQFSQLAQPKNDFDIEDHDLKGDVFQNDSEEGLDLSDGGDDATLRNEHYVSASKSKLRQQTDAVELGNKYTGSVTNRKDLYDDIENFEDLGIDLEEENLEENNLEEGDEDDGSDSGASLSGSESDSDSEDDEGSGNDTKNADLEHKRSKLKELMAGERTHIVSRLSNSATTDSVKGFAISQQHKFFDKVIDTRLKLQKSLTNSNLLPPNRDTLESEDLASTKTPKYLNQAKEECFNLLDSILALRNKLLESDQIAPKVQTPKKRSFKEYSKVTSKLDSTLNEYRSQVLTKWSAKIQNSSGSSAINAGKFKAINQSFEQQVQNNLTDMDRLVKRTKLNRRKISPLGYEYYKSTQANVESEEEEEENPDIPNESKQNGTANAEIEEIFDDEDFYRVLLNDLVDKKIQTANPTNGLTISMRTAQQAQKFKKNVDTKASKGRKLRYHVQEQIANFDTPRTSLKWNDEQIDEFFASLLGQKVNMNEIDEDDEEDDEEVEVGEDTIKLFG